MKVCLLSSQLFSSSDELLYAEPFSPSYLYTWSDILWKPMLVSMAHSNVYFFCEFGLFKRILLLFWLPNEAVLKISSSLRDPRSYFLMLWRFITTQSLELVSLQKNQNIFKSADF